ncbi:MAG: hypothetical protein HQL32_00960 [Planctomycetes bacterium]|nr:hypothetical protein [Planctomycetota bacterium]
MRLEKFYTNLKVIELLRNKVLDPKIDHPLEHHYYNIVKQMEDLSPEDIANYMSMWMRGVDENTQIKNRISA